MAFTRTNLGTGSVPNSTAGTTGVAVSVTKPTAVGQLLTAAMYVNGASVSLPTISDNTGATWTPLPATFQPVSSTGISGVWYRRANANDITGGSPGLSTVTFKWTGTSGGSSSTVTGISVDQFGTFFGTATLDLASSNANTVSGLTDTLNLSATGARTTELAYSVLAANPPSGTAMPVTTGGTNQTVYSPDNSTTFYNLSVGTAIGQFIIGWATSTNTGSKSKWKWTWSGANATDAIYGATFYDVIAGTATDTIALSDAAHGVGPGRATDTIALSDSAHTKGTVGHATDTVALSDSARGLAPAHATDTITLSDSARGTGPGHATDTVTLSDAAHSPGLGHATDALTLADSARALGPGHATDTVAVADAAHGVGPGTSADSVSLADTAHSPGRGHATDAVALGDAARATGPGRATDAVALSDVATGVAGILAHATDAITVGDVAHTSAAPSHATDTVTIADTAGATHTVTGRATDTITISDGAHGVGGGHATDAIVLIDSARGGAAAVQPPATGTLSTRASIIVAWRFGTLSIAGPEDGNPPTTDATVETAWKMGKIKVAS